MEYDNIYCIDVLPYFCNIICKSSDAHDIIEGYSQKKEYKYLELRNNIKYEIIIKNMYLSKDEEEKLNKVSSIILNKDLYEMFILDLSIIIWKDIYEYFLDKIEIDIEDFYNKSIKLFTTEISDARLIILIALCRICNKQFFDPSLINQNIYNIYRRHNDQVIGIDLDRYKIDYGPNYSDIIATPYTFEMYSRFLCYIKDTNFNDNSDKFFYEQFKVKLHKKYYLFIGGRKSIHVKIKSFIDESFYGIRFLGPEELNFDRKLIGKCNAIIFYVEFLGHAMFYKAMGAIKKEQKKGNRISIRYVKGNNVDLILKQMNIIQF